MTLTATHRVAVRDPENANVPFYYDQPCFESAKVAFRLLQDYARDGVTAWIEQRIPGGWKAVGEGELRR